MEKQSNSLFPKYIISSSGSIQNTGLFINVTTQIIEPQSIDQQIINQFLNKGIVKTFKGKTQNIYLNPRQASKYKIESSCEIVFKEEISHLNDFIGIASDLISNAYKFSRKSTKQSSLSLIFTNQNEQIKDKIKVAIYLAQAKIRSKEWANGRGDIQGSPQYFIDQSKRLQTQYGVKRTIISGDNLLKQNFRLMHAVGRGSQKQPTFINLTYNGNPNEKKYIALIGKGVCFDAGGLDIKSAQAMQIMFLDKQGASSVLSAFEQIVKLKLKINVTCSIGMVQNVISSKSYRPGDIIKSRKGLTVMIEDTDAQGRLTLADVMNWTQENYQVQTMIQLSTLTYSCMKGLGHRYTGLFGNCQKLKNVLIQIGNQVHEYLWSMPIDDDYKQILQCNEADCKSDDSQALGGGSIAAVFLQKFVQKGVSWAHLDIAGPAIVNNEGTGWGSKLLIQYCKSRSQTIKKKKN